MLPGLGSGDLVYMLSSQSKNFTDSYFFSPTKGSYSPRNQSEEGHCSGLEI